MERTGTSTMVLYGSSIALVSGAYSVAMATTGPEMTTSAWLMFALGVIVLVHGVALLTPVAARLQGTSGPLMILYSLLMLLNQVWMATMAPSTTRGSTGMNGMGGMNGVDTVGGATGMGSLTAGVGWDAGMVALAILMLASGVIMTARRGGMDGEMDQSSTDAMA